MTPRRAGRQTRPYQGVAKPGRCHTATAATFKGLPALLPVRNHSMAAAKTTDPDQLARHRAEYAHDVVNRNGRSDPAVEAAFAKVPREAFLGRSPWRIGDGGPPRERRWSKTSDPAKLYQDVLVTLKQDKGINNGQPSLHALCLVALKLTTTDRALHIGTGTGYYTAIIAQLAGSVDGGYEIEPDLASLAAANLRAHPNVTIHGASPRPDGRCRKLMRSMSAKPAPRGRTHPGSTRCATAAGCCFRSQVTVGFGAPCCVSNAWAIVSRRASYRVAASSPAPAHAITVPPRG